MGTGSRFLCSYPDRNKMDLRLGSEKRNVLFVTRWIMTSSSKLSSLRKALKPAPLGKLTARLVNIHRRRSDRQGLCTYLLDQARPPPAIASLACRTTPAEKHLECSSGIKKQCLFSSYSLQGKTKTMTKTIVVEVPPFYRLRAGITFFSSTLGGDLP